MPGLKTRSHPSTPHAIFWDESADDTSAMRRGLEDVTTLCVATCPTRQTAATQSDTDGADEEPERLRHLVKTF